MIYPTDKDNQAAYLRLKEAIARDYPRGQFVAIFGGQIVADAPTFEELSARLQATGKDSRDILVVEAESKYPEYVTIFFPQAVHATANSECCLRSGDRNPRTDTILGHAGSYEFLRDPVFCPVTLDPDLPIDHIHVNKTAMHAPPVFPPKDHEQVAVGIVIKHGFKLNVTVCVRNACMIRQDLANQFAVNGNGIHWLDDHLRLCVKYDGTYHIENSPAESVGTTAASTLAALTCSI